MKILVLTGSPRKNGNSNILAENFIKGAQEAGHEVVRFDSAFRNVHTCVACDSCGTKGQCVFKDDFEIVKENLINADMVVFSSPVYYFGISAQLKTVIDRFYSINGEIQTPKKSILILTYADTSKNLADPIIAQYTNMINYLGWKDCAQFIVSGVWQTGSVNQTNFPQQIYNFGKNL